MDKEVSGIAEFRSFSEESSIDSQINRWLKKYPQVTVLDVKYQVAPYVDGDTLNFATFALVMFHEAKVPTANRAATQRMEIPDGIKGTG